MSLKVADDNGIYIVTLNREAVHNALDTQTIYDLRSTIEYIDRCPGIKVVILTGEGGKTFCAGADLKERKTFNDEQVKSFVSLISSTATMLQEVKVPVIAAMNGSSFGGGLELALAADIRVIEAHAKVGLTETSLGIIPGAGGTQRLSRLIGLSRAKELIFTAKVIESDEALEYGMVNEVTPRGEALSTSMKLARTICKNAPLAVREAKKCINKGIEKELGDALEFEQECYRRLIPTKDRLEGLKAFSEKRVPKYRGE